MHYIMRDNLIFVFNIAFLWLITVYRENTRMYFLKPGILFAIVFFFFSFNYSFALEDTEPPSDLTSIDSFFNSFKVDLPEAEVTCRAGGSLSKIFTKVLKLKVGGNVFFIDKESKEIAQFERAETDDPILGKLKLNMFIKVSGLDRSDFTNLILFKKLVATNNAKIIFVIKNEKSDGSNDEVYLYDGKNSEGEIENAILYTKINKVRTKTYNLNKFFVANGFIKIRFPFPPLKIKEDGSLENVFGNEPGNITCYCVDCPIHDYDLTDLKDAFDGQLVDDITQEAIKNSVEE